MSQPSAKRHRFLTALLTISAFTTGLWNSSTAIGQAQLLSPLPNTPGLSSTGIGRATVPADGALVVLSYYFLPNDSNMLATMSLSPRARPADYQPIVVALTDLGVTDVKTAAYANGSAFVTMQFSLTQPTLERLTEIIKAANTAATKDNQFSIASINVGLTVNDCSAAEEQARQLALVDLQRRSQAIAAAAGVQLGDRVAIADATYWSSLLTGACPVTSNVNSASPDSSSLPLFDARVGTTVGVTHQVTATYEVKR